MSEVPDPRFGGVSRVYGQQALNHFQQLHIVVAGLGGVGSWAVEALARTGIGKLTLIDLDDVCTTNINRQLPATDDTIGQLKTEVLAQRVKSINPNCEVKVIDDFLLPEKFEEYLTGADAVLDAIDSVNTKAALVAWCKRRKLRLVVCGGAGGQIDPGMIRVGDLAKAKQDPLLAKVRSQLRRDYGFSKNPKRKWGVDCVYSEEQLRYPVISGELEGEVTLQKPGSGSMRMDCSSGFGAAMVVTCSFAMQATATLLKRLAPVK
ncbi:MULTISPECIES: tRNA cyclic N6-threonylcarbamoyladenosine(37) synthase TcdA [Idiomarina]|jgi:tRNA A37 threonylcarbamoyladenosine dehydratase|nr:MULTISPECIES: tRNA cyclic N6-threonylcarbamoyladenosine(37) synthase TcdA [Idiomarina]MAO68576.1 tRNA cyclic N6-threonylcarbamoyladenosine(37) synthase TcdA [Idiomarina sp.]MBF81275.1 tRNA cyclic N6-threonylcarbamoyladenosine(37) synthase TcdA [Idiomarina sp.]MBP59079.1 tRNA cyclic N6-threonylcarbamoyladenosine(37) synthase TcdA [Idiomarina sp.]|tara:strand:- start:37356 stop:38144 length:789 start_codon:yes stop_codon:yes gene_type:complete